MKRSYAVLILVWLVLGPAVLWSADEPVHVMLANDDGIDSPGLIAIAEAIAADPAYRLTVVAPARQQSAMGHALTIRGEIEVREYEAIAGAPAWSVDATPASVVRVGLTALLKDDPPELVVSGINRGENDGLGSWVSGTVAAAREAALAGIPSIALSLQIEWSDPNPQWATAAAWCKPVIDAVVREGLPAGVYLNVNVPMHASKARGYRVARMGLDESAVSRYDLARVDSDGVRWYVNVWRPPEVTEPGRDGHALGQGWVTIAPLEMDHTSEQTLHHLQHLDLPAKRAVTDE
jgi:5'-nucleotidase